MVMSFMLAFVACGPNDIAVTGVTLDKESATLEVGDTLKLNATVEPADALDKTIIWDTANDNVATVSMSGNVTAVGAGLTVITVTTVDGDFTAECIITVTATDPGDQPGDGPDAPVVPEDPSDPNEPDDPVVPEDPSDPNEPDDPVVPEDPTDPDEPDDPVVPEDPTDPDEPDDPVVPEDPTDPDNPDDPPVGPEDPTEPEEPETIAVTGVMLNLGEITMQIGDVETLIATVLPANATNKNVGWSSLAGSVASVDDGVITALTAGTTKIIVTTVDGSFSAECVVIVENNETPVIPVSGITISKTTLELVAGATYKLEATVLPNNATNQGVSWSSDDETVLVVDENGNVRTKKAGTATVTVSTVDGGYTATCVITVSSLALNYTEITLSNVSSDHKVCQLEFTHEIGTPDEIIWTSLNSSVATVSNSGLVTGVANGETKIKVDVRYGTDVISVTCTVHVQFSGITLPEQPL